MSQLFNSLFDSVSEVIPVYQFLLCIGVSLLIGLILAKAYTYKTRYHVNFVRTLAILPAVVCVVIMMVNGNVGTGVAVAGAFSLVRFRSVPGSAKDIGAIFIAMGAGLMCGMGYLGYAVLFSLVLSAIMMLYVYVQLWEVKEIKHKTLVMTIPEDINYTNAFDDIFKQYSENYALTQVKTTNMGSLFKLTYQLELKDVSQEKEMIDALRCRNGNLEIMMMNQENNQMNLL